MPKIKFAYDEGAAAAKQEERFGQEEMIRAQVYGLLDRAFDNQAYFEAREERAIWLTIHDALQTAAIWYESKGFRPFDSGRITR